MGKILWVAAASLIAVLGLLSPGTEETELSEVARQMERFIAAYDATLELWPVAFEELDVETRFGSTHLIASGPVGAHPILLLHAASASATMWFPTVGSLSGNFRVYAVDTIGDAGKSVITEAVKTTDDYADWLADVLDALGIERASVVGASHGGWIAMTLARLFPERVARVVLLSPANALVQFNLLFGLRVIPSNLFPTRPLILRSIRPLFASTPNPIYLEQLILSASAPRQMLWPKVLTDQELSVIEAPTLLLIGEEEVVISKLQEAVYRAARWMPSVEVAIIPSASHFLNIDQPALVNRRIMSFLQGEE